MLACCTGIYASRQHASFSAPAAVCEHIICASSPSLHRLLCFHSRVLSLVCSCRSPPCVPILSHVEFRFLPCSRHPHFHSIPALFCVFALCSRCYGAALGTHYIVPTHPPLLHSTPNPKQTPTLHTTPPPTPQCLQCPDPRLNTLPPLGLRP